MRFFNNSCWHDIKGYEEKRLKHPELIVNDFDEDLDDEMAELYERLPRSDSKISNDETLAKFMKSKRDRSHSLPSVHGQFLLVNRGWAPAGGIIPEDQERSEVIFFEIFISF